MTSIHPTALLTLLLIATAAAAACTDRNYAASTVTEANNNSTSNGNTSNGNTSNGAVPACTDVITSAEVGYLTNELSEFTNAFLSDNTILVHKRTTGGANNANDFDLFQFDPVQNTTTQLTANDADDYIVDTSGTAFLSVRQQTNSQQLIYTNGDRNQVLSDNFFFQGFNFSFAFIRRHQLSSNGAAWATADSAIAWWDTIEPRIISGDRINNANPTINGDRVAWTSYDGEDHEIVFFDGDQTRDITDNTLFDQNPLVGDDHVFWIRTDPNGINNTQVWLYDILTQTSRVIHQDDNCQLANTYQNQLLFACNEPDISGTPGVTSLWRFDGETTQPVATTGAMISIARIYDDRVAWAEYDDPDAWCGSQAIGRIMLAQGDREPLTIDAVGAGCWCCGAIWPEARLELNANLITWNYAISEDTPNRENIGYAVLNTESECP